MSKSKPLSKAIARKLAKAQVTPEDLGAYIELMTGSTDALTKGGTKGVIAIAKQWLDELAAGVTAAASAAKVNRLARLVGSAPPMKRVTRTERGRYLLARPEVDAKDFDFPLDTRRTGGVREARALQFKDKSVEFEMAGEILESLTPLRGRPGMDYSTPFKLGTKKRYKGVTLEGYERAHAWGPGFGDEAKAAIMYAPREFNQAWQNHHIEARIREGARAVQEAGGTFVLRVKVRSFPPEDPLLRDVLRVRDQEFLMKEISYFIEVTRKDGSIGRARIDFEIPPPGSKGKVLVSVPEGSDLFPDFP